LDQNGTDVSLIATYNCLCLGNQKRSVDGASRWGKMINSILQLWMAIDKDDEVFEYIRGQIAVFLLFFSFKVIFFFLNLSKKILAFYSILTCAALRF